MEVPVGDGTAWWNSGPEGLEQGWTIREGDAQVVVGLALELGRVLSIDMDGGGAILEGSAGGLWRYGGLKAWDAAGRDLDTWMEQSGAGLRVLASTAGVIWPVTVDPPLTPVEWVEEKITASDGEASDGFGKSLSIAGDLDGDGYDDLVVGSGTGDDGADSGSVYVYYGAADGIDISSEQKLTASDAETNNHFGSSVSGAGDLDGDGYDDLVVGAYHGEGASGMTGCAYVYYGSAVGVVASSEQKLTASDGAYGDMYGVAVSSAGDLDGDGYDDVVVGAYHDGDDGEDSGSAYVYHGSSDGIDSDSEQKLNASDGAESDEFGYAIAGAGDLDGDGYDDLVVGAYYDDDMGSQSGSVYVYYGSSGGLDGSSEQKLGASDGAAGDLFGYAVSGSGDLDGDGHDDLLVGAHKDDDLGSSSGSAYVYRGSSSGIDASTEQKLTASDGTTYGAFGNAVSGAGDLDMDGYADLLVGAGSAAYVHYGSSVDIDTDSEQKLTPSDGADSASFGLTLSGSGDLDGDGYDDLVVGAYNDDDLGMDSGSVYVFYGSCRDEDGDGYCTSTDCDDADIRVGEGPLWYADADGDGYGDASSAINACSEPSGYVDNTDDCDDSEALAWTGATEVCDGADNDCDGTVDNDDAVDASTWYVDTDGDGYGVSAGTTVACDEPSGYADNTEDCDDDEPLAWTGATEVCDSVDNDCDGTVDNDDAADASTWYPDTDGDGYGVREPTTTACTQPSGHVDNPNDCDDTEAHVFPGADEIRGDGIDQDCDGTDPPEANERGCGGCASTSRSPPARWLLILPLLLFGARQRSTRAPTRGT